MHTPKMMVAAAAMLATVSTGASALTLPGGGGIAPAVDAVAMTENAAVYVYSGRRYCFYPDGWRGPGWYRCGFAWRHGLGWGGVYGWNNWRDDRFHRRHGFDFRFRDRREGRGEFRRDRREGRGEFRREGREEFRREGGDMRRGERGGERGTVGAGPRSGGDRGDRGGMRSQGGPGGDGGGMGAGGGGFAR